MTRRDRTFSPLLAPESAHFKGVAAQSFQTAATDARASWFHFVVESARVLAESITYGYGRSRAGETNAFVEYLSYSALSYLWKCRTGCFSGMHASGPNFRTEIAKTRCQPSVIPILQDHPPTH